MEFDAKKKKKKKKKIANALHYVFKSEVGSCPKLKLQPVLSFSSFVHNSSINENKNMKLRENICYEMIY